MNLQPYVAIILATACTTMLACDRPTNRPVTTDVTQPDNTGRNKADREEASRTPLNQSNSSADIDITATIRRAVMDDSTLSTNAKNCKIITEKGVVTLRGPVGSQAEKDAIGAKARAAAGVTSVDNQLEVTTP